MAEFGSCSRLTTLGNCLIVQPFISGHFTQSGFGDLFWSPWSVWIFTDRKNSSESRVPVWLVTSFQPLITKMWIRVSSVLEKHVNSRCEAAQMNLCVSCGRLLFHTSAFCLLHVHFPMWWCRHQQCGTPCNASLLLFFWRLPAKFLVVALIAS